MGMNVLFFERSQAPERADAFWQWHAKVTAWDEPVDYNDPMTTTAALRDFYYDLIQTYPPMSGPCALSDEELAAKGLSDEHTSDYTIAPTVLYADFPYAIIDDKDYDVYETIFELAEDHGITAMTYDHPCIFFPGTSVIELTEGREWYLPDEEVEAREKGGFWQKVQHLFKGNGR